MSSLFDDAMMGAKVASALFKGATKLGKIAADGIQKVNESGKFQNLKTDIQHRVSNSETWHSVRTEVPHQGDRVTAAQPSAAKKYCPQCGTSLELSARFCSKCGTAQEEAAMAEEYPVIREPEPFEALPTVLENGQEEIPDIFGFQPSKSVEVKRTAVKRERVFERKVNKNTEPFTGYYCMEKPGFEDVSLRVYQKDQYVCFEYFDTVNGKHIYQFDDYDAAGNYLYCRAWDYQFKFIYHEDGRMELDTYDVYPGLSGFYRCLD